MTKKISAASTMKNVVSGSDNSVFTLLLEQKGGTGKSRIAQILVEAFAKNAPLPPVDKVRRYGPKVPTRKHW